MGIIKQGILGGFSKKVGGVVGTSWKGIAVMKSMPQSVVNPRTTLQVTQRNAFRDTAKVASLLLTPTIQECWNRWAKRESGYNAFIKKNVDIMKRADNVITLFGGNMVISDGELTLPNLAGTTSESEDTTTFIATWSGNATGGRYDKATDIVKMGCLIIGITDNVTDFSTARVIYADDVVRTAGTMSLTVDALAENEGVIPFMYVVSADGYFRSENLNYFSKVE